MTSFVIRSMSTTDYVVASRGQPAQKPVPYHIYLLPAEKRAGAWWTRSLHEAAKFATMEDAKAQQDAYPQWLAGTEIAPRDAEARGLPTYWANQRARTAAKLAALAAKKATAAETCLSGLEDVKRGHDDGACVTDGNVYVCWDGDFEYYQGYDGRGPMTRAEAIAYLLSRI